MSQLLARAARAGEIIILSCVWSLCVVVVCGVDVFVSPVLIMFYVSL